MSSHLYGSPDCVHRPMFEVVAVIDDAAWTLFGVIPSNITLGEN
jgi:hypothetical protein